MIWQCILPESKDKSLSTLSYECNFDVKNKYEH